MIFIHVRAFEVVPITFFLFFLEMAANKGYLAGKTLFITGASRGIGREIALKAARDGAKIVIAAKTKDPHPKLPGTIFTVAKEVEEVNCRKLENF